MEDSMLNNILSTGQIFVPYNGKIADITHADTANHTLTLANAAGTGAIAGETRKIIMVLLKQVRIGGVACILYYPNEGVNYSPTTYSSSTIHPIVIANGLQRLQYALDTAGDDFDLYCFGYVVEA